MFDYERQMFSCISNLLVATSNPLHVGKGKFCNIIASSMQFLRDLRDFFQVMFKIQVQQTDEDDDVQDGGNKVLLSCVGVSFTNINKTMV